MCLGLDGWIEELRHHNEETCRVIIVGNKCDLEENRAVNTSEAEEYALKNNAAFFEASAKSGTNVSIIFETLINEIVDCLKASETDGNTPGSRKTYG